MRAIRVHEFGSPEVMRLEEIPDPAPGPGQVLVRLHAAGVNPADTYIRTGTYAAYKPALPYTPGSDGAGIVEAVGSGVNMFKPGDRVYVFTRAGTYAERWVYDAGELYALPERLTFSQGAALGVAYGTAHRTLFGRARAQKGETLLIHGASGGVGTATVQLARAHGMTIVGTAGTDEGLKLVRELGAHHAVNHRAPNYLTELMSLTNGRGYDVIVEMLANVNLDKDLGMLARQGRVVVVGNRGRVEIDARQTMARDAAILGMALWNATPDELNAIHKELGRGLADGTLQPIVGRELPLEQAPEAHKAVMDSGAHGKIVLIP